jgi:Fe2+ or Zn2+ uptake regulation protein
MSTSIHIPNLNAFGIRNTRLVKAILEILETSKQPVSFEEITERVVNMIGSPDRASFYRAILRLKEKNLIIEVSHKTFVSSLKKTKKSPRYLVSCLSCHKTEKIKNSTIIESEILSNQLSKIEVVTLSGVCNECDNIQHVSNEELCN